MSTINEALRALNRLNEDVDETENEDWTDSEIEDEITGHKHLRTYDEIYRAIDDDLWNPSWFGFYHDFNRDLAGYLNGKYHPALSDLKNNLISMLDRIIKYFKLILSDIPDYIDTCRHESQIYIDSSYLTKDILKDILTKSFNTFAQKQLDAISSADIYEPIKDALVAIIQRYQEPVLNLNEDLEDDDWSDDELEKAVLADVDDSMYDNVVGNILWDFENNLLSDIFNNLHDFLDTLSYEHPAESDVEKGIREFESTVNSVLFLVRYSVDHDQFLTRFLTDAVSFVCDINHLDLTPLIGQFLRHKISIEWESAKANFIFDINESHIPEDVKTKLKEILNVKF